MWQFPYSAEFLLPGYSNLEFKLRSDNVQGGGVGVYVKNNIKFKILNNLSIFTDRIFESIFIEIQLENKTKFVIGNIYRPGSAHPTLSAGELYSNFFEIFSNLISEANFLKCTLTSKRRVYCQNHRTTSHKERSHRVQMLLYSILFPYKRNF